MKDIFEKLTGQHALVVGGGDGLVQAVQARYESVLIANPDRAANLTTPSRVLQDPARRYLAGEAASPDRIKGPFDALFMAFWLANRDDPVADLLPWIQLLVPQGRMVLLEWSAHPQQTSSGATLHGRLLETLEEAKLLQRPSTREMTHWLRSCGLIHVRQSTEQAPTIFTDEDLKFMAADGLALLDRLGESGSRLARELRKNSIEPSPVSIAYGIHKPKIPAAEVSIVTEDPRIDADSASGELVPGSGLLDSLTQALAFEVEDARRIAQRLLQAYGRKALRAIRDHNLITRELGLSPAVGKKLVAWLQAGYWLHQDQGTDTVEIHGPEDAYQYLSPQMSSLTKEHFRGLYLNVKGILVSEEIISIGTLTSALVHPREVFGPAIERRSHSVLIAHNHPSGDPNPSPEDIHLTRELAEAGRLLNIELLDHIIIGAKGYVSMKEKRYF